MIVAKEYVGYRTETISSGPRDIISVCHFEMNELGNEDIPDTLCELGYIGSSSMAEAMAFIESLHRSGYMEAVWICDTPEAVTNYYSTEYHTIQRGEIDTLTVKGILISDLGNEGMLIAYRDGDAFPQEEQNEVL